MMYLLVYLIVNALVTLLNLQCDAGGGKSVWERLKYKSMRDVKYKDGPSGKDVGSKE